MDTELMIDPPVLTIEPSGYLNFATQHVMKLHSQSQTTSGIFPAQPEVSRDWPFLGNRESGSIKTEM